MRGMIPLVKRSLLLHFYFAMNYIHCIHKYSKNNKEGDQHQALGNL